MSLPRRTFLLGTLAAGATAASGARAAGYPYPFMLGIASGEPSPKGLILWTRLVSRPLAEDGCGGMPDNDIAVDWQLSNTEHFGQIVTAGTVTARKADAHAVHVVVGGLRPGAEYFYRFRARGHVSPTGRTRTAPESQHLDRLLRMAFASCNLYEGGYYTAYRRMAEDQPDLIFFLGDYIYEGAPEPKAVRKHVGEECVTLADYRRRYAQYKSDSDLQAAHEIAPWVAVPDDHEVENDWAGTHRAELLPPLTPQEWLTRRAAAFQAYRENLPLDPRLETFYRRIRWGRLATFHMLDTRLFRDAQACGDGWKVCAEADDPRRTITGKLQEEWLLDGLAKRDAVWNIIGQQVMFAQALSVKMAGNMDSWDGYRASRQRIQNGIVDRHVRNPVILTGDVHRGRANNLKLDYNDPSSPVIGAEFVCTSIGSAGDGDATTAVPNGVNNPHLKFYSNRRGYCLSELTPDRMRTAFRVVDYISLPGAPVRTAGTFAVQNGVPGLHRI